MLHLVIEAAESQLWWESAEYEIDRPLLVVNP